MIFARVLIFHHKLSTFAVLSVFFLLSNVGKTSREENPHPKFIYTNPSIARYVTDYQIHLAPSEDYNGRDQNARGSPDFDDEEKHVRPSFLKDSYAKKRVVQFYSPWSGLCQTFSREYVHLARQVQSIDKNGADIEFFAISCSAHHWVCKEHNVNSYPTIKAYHEFSNDAMILFWEKLTSNVVLTAFKIDVENSQRTRDLEFQSKHQETKDRDDIRIKHLHRPQQLVDQSEVEIGHEGDEFGYSHETVDILGASIPVYQMVKRERYADAALSLTYTLRHYIYSDDRVNIDSTTSLLSTKTDAASSHLTENQKIAFIEWIDLLRWSLPPNWKVHTLINDIQNNMDSVLKSRTELIKIVDLHHDVVHEPSFYRAAGKEIEFKWSKTCQRTAMIERGAIHEMTTNHAVHLLPGYICGMWNLFHIMSIGIVERQNAVLGARERTTQFNTFQVLCLFLQQFSQMTFTPKSSFSFLKEKLIHCIINSCVELPQRPQQSLKHQKKNMKQLPLWLWNVRNEYKAESKRNRKGGPRFHAGEVWPSKLKCPTCYGDSKSGKWNEDALYLLLKQEYWPSGVHNFRYTVLDPRPPIDLNVDASYAISIRSFILQYSNAIIFIIISSFLVYGGSFLYNMVRQKKIDRTGRHKKNLAEESTRHETPQKQKRTSSESWAYRRRTSSHRVSRIPVSRREDTDYKRVLP